MKKSQRYALFYSVFLIIVAFIYGTFLYHGSPACVHPSEGEVAMYCLDVGQGDATLFLLPDGKTMLVDTGSESEAPMVVDFLKTMDVASLDVLVCTHWHEDHVGGVPAILRTFPVEALYAPSLPEGKEADGFDVQVAAAGDVVLEEDDYKVMFCSPIKGEQRDGNEASLVTRVSYGNTAFMIMGDATHQSEKDMLKAGMALPSTVLRVGHHGSDTSSSAAFLKAVMPTYAIISVGENSYNLPSYEVQKRLSDRGCTLLRTDRCGNIALLSDGTAIRVVTDRESES